jgi:hypothetical protein
MATIKELERVVLTAPLPNEHLESGDVGTVVHVYRDEAIEVEFTTLDGNTAVVTVADSQVRLSLASKSHARQLAAS